MTNEIHQPERYTCCTNNLPLKHQRIFHTESNIDASLSKTQVKGLYNKSDQFMLICTFSSSNRIPFILCMSTSNILRALHSLSLVRRSLSLALAACIGVPYLVTMETRCKGAYCWSICCITISALCSSVKNNFNFIKYLY